MEQKCSGILLAGGASSRMGRDKTALQWNNVTLLEWQAEKLRRAGADEILLCGRSDCAIPDVRCVPDVLPRRGPLGGLYSGLMAASHPAAMVISADVPLLPAETLRELYLAHKSDITVLRHGEHIEPLIGIYDCNLAPLLLSLIREGSAPVRALLRQCTWESIPFDGDPQLLCNCNTPEKYEEALRYAKLLK